MNLVPDDKTEFDDKTEITIQSTEMIPERDTDSPRTWRQFWGELRGFIGWKPLHLADRFAEAEAAKREAEAFTRKADGEARLIEARTAFELAKAEAAKREAEAEKARAEADRCRAEAAKTQAEAEQIKSQTHANDLVQRMLQTNTTEEALNDLNAVITKIRLLGGQVEGDYPDDEISATEFGLFEAIRDLSDELCNSDGKITALIAESNAAFWRYDSAEIVELEQKRPNEFSFKAHLQLCGDQIQDKMYCGTRITSSITGSLSLEDGCWKITDYVLLGPDLLFE